MDKKINSPLKYFKKDFIKNGDRLPILPCGSFRYPTTFKSIEGKKIFHITENTFYLENRNVLVNIYPDSLFYCPDVFNPF